MGLFTKLLDANRAKSSVRQEVSSTALKVAPQASDYENLFAQVRPLVDEMVTTEIYGIGKNGAKLLPSRTPELNVLNIPNEDMGRIEFLDTAITTWLTEREVNIRVHLDARRNVYGFTILPVGCRSLKADGTNEFTVRLSDGSIERLSDAEVMTLRYSRSTHNIDKGVSPATASHYWAVIDDLVAQYQRAFFENGAVPATITFITASTREAYEEKRRALETGLKGARNKNKTVYAWRQLLSDNTTGDELEVKTIQGNNSTLALKDIIEIVTNKLNMNFGVSNFIMGDDSSAKYDNAELSDHQFTKRRVFPALVKWWSEFQHELDRIVGGLGYAIDFSLEIPELTDRLKTQAETRKIEAETARIEGERENARSDVLIKLVQAGADPKAACSATGLITLPWQTVAQTVYERTLEQSANTLPAPTIAKLETASNGQSEGISDELQCDCHEHQHRTTDDLGWQPVFTEDEAAAEAIYSNLAKLAKQIAQEVVTNNPQYDLKEVEEAIYKILTGEATVGAESGVGAIKAIVADEDVLDAIADEIAENGLVLNAELQQQLRMRTELAVAHFAEDAKKKAQALVENALESGTDKDELEAMLSEFTNASRAEMIARNESHNAINAGRYFEVNDLAKEFNLDVELEWVAHLDDTTCEICRAMDGKVVKMGEAWPEHIMTDDGAEIAFDHNVYNMDGKACNAHSRCRCTFAVRMRAK